MKNKSKKLQDLINILDIQGQNGNWNYDPYMMGLYNGMEMARSIFAETKPVFKDAPKRWLSKPTLNNRFRLFLSRFLKTDIEKGLNAK